MDAVAHSLPPSEHRVFRTLPCVTEAARKARRESTTKYSPSPSAYPTVDVWFHLSAAQPSYDHLSGERRRRKGTQGISGPVRLLNCDPVGVVSHQLGRRKEPEKTELSVAFQPDRESHLLSHMTSENSARPYSYVLIDRPMLTGLQGSYSGPYPPLSLTTSVVRPLTKGEMDGFTIRS